MASAGWLPELLPDPVRVPPGAAPPVPVLDEAVFDGVADLLGPARMARFMGLLRSRGIAAEGGLDGDGSDLASMLHTLASSAGMFGFGQVLAAARAGEHHLRAGPDPMPAGLAHELRAAIAAMQGELSRRLAASGPRDGVAA